MLFSLVLFLLILGLNFSPLLSVDAGSLIIETDYFNMNTELLDEAPGTLLSENEF